MLSGRSSAYWQIGKPMPEPEKRAAVIFTLHPPESLRDAPIEKIRAVLRANADTLLEGMAQEIRRFFTSAPLDQQQATRLAAALREEIRLKPELSGEYGVVAERLEEGGK